MDKRSKKLKQLRRESRIREKEEKKSKVLEKVNMHKASLGQHTLGNEYKDLVYSQFQKIQSQFQLNGATYAIYTVMCTLSSKHKISKKNILDYLDKVLSIINAIYAGDRTTEKIEEELLLETGIDPRKVKMLPIKEAPEKIVLFSAALSCLTVAMYPLYFYWNWHQRKRGMPFTDIYDEMVTELRNNILLDNYENLRETVFKKFAVTFAENGAMLKVTRI